MQQSNKRKDKRKHKRNTFSGDCSTARRLRISYYHSGAYSIGEGHCWTGFTCSHSLIDTLVMPGAPLQCWSTQDLGARSHAILSSEAFPASPTLKACPRLHRCHATSYITSKSSRSGLCSAARSQLAPAPGFQSFQSKIDTEKDQDAKATDSGERSGADSAGAAEDASDTKKSTEAKDSQPSPPDPPPTPEYEFNRQLWTAIVT